MASSLLAPAILSLPLTVLGIQLIGTCSHAWLFTWVLMTRRNSGQAYLPKEASTHSQDDLLFNYLVTQVRGFNRKVRTHGLIPVRGSGESSIYNVRAHHAENTRLIPSIRVTSVGFMAVISRCLLSGCRAFLLSQLAECSQSKARAGLLTNLPA